MLLTGTFGRSMDGQQRVAVPKCFRVGSESTEREVFYLAPGTDGSLCLYPEAAFAQLAERLARVSPTRQDVRAFTRLFYARAQRVELDSQGRVRIPPALAELAGLEKEVVLLGVQDHIELWAAQTWEAYSAEKRSDYDQIADSAFRE